MHFEVFSHGVTPDLRLNQWWEYLLVAQETKKNVLCQEKTGFRFTTEPTILGSKNGTTWPGFLWNMAAVTAPGFVHYGSISHRPMICKAAS